MSQLSGTELSALISRVCPAMDGDKKLAILVDMPDEVVADTPAWKDRREMAHSWASALQQEKDNLGLDEVGLVLYRNPHANNADLPTEGYVYTGRPLPSNADELDGRALPFADIFAGHQLLVAPTQFSATAPLKMAAKQYGFRAATMPGFSREMIPALRLDYSVIGKRVNQLTGILDHAAHCGIDFDADGTDYHVDLDLRHRKGTSSGGVFPTAGTAGNLPSGESYIVPYEGELENDPSQTDGFIPVQFGDDVVVYRVEENRAYEIVSDNPASAVEAKKLLDEPAYGNIAELGLGVLGDFGLAPTGEILLDEKLGLHIAFGRSEHFGGQVAPSDFSAPDKVVHIDRVYIEALQPKVTIQKAELTLEDGSQLLLMEDGAYRIQFED